MDNYLELSNKYNTFIYDSFNVDDIGDKYRLTFNFIVPNLTEYHPYIEVDKFDINSFSKYLVFHIGLIELISYWKCTCSKNVIIKAGYIDDEQINWFKKIYYYGLGELFYTNGINVSIDDFMNIECDANKEDIEYPDYKGIGNLIPIGGGKDSNVTLEILKGLDNDTFIINPKEVTLACSQLGGYEQPITVKRVLDRNMLELNKKGFINGHTPFSACVSFISYLCAYSHNKKYIVLSNENSANESNVFGTKINHQYSKTYEYENDFNNYTKKYFKIDIHYFSLLRPLSEYQIGMLFSHYDKYHKVFKSCNVGSKTEPWKWCCNCPKCLFVYTILSPFLYKDKLIDIFGEDLFEKKELLDTFIELIGYGNNKPFECVGTYSEVRYAVSRLIKELDTLPYLVQYYKDNYELEDLNDRLESKWNSENNVPKEFIDLVREELDKYV